MKQNYIENVKCKCKTCGKHINKNLEKRFSYFIFLFFESRRPQINYDFYGLMAIMTNKPIMAIMTIVNITTNMTNYANCAPFQDTKTPLAKKGFRAN